MQYKYVTENNLETKQNYMYSEFLGKEFLDCFIQNRLTYIHNNDSGTKELDILAFCNLATENLTEKRFLNIYIDLLKSEENFVKLKFEIDQFIKSFEVRKRIYSEYDFMYKPLEGASYNNYQSYLIFLLILVKIYEISKSNKYLSCLIKINDTIISIAKELDLAQKIIHKHIIGKEIFFVSNLCNEKKIQMEILS